MPLHTTNFDSVSISLSFGNQVDIMVTLLLVGKLSTFQPLGVAEAIQQPPSVLSVVFFPLNLLEDLRFGDFVFPLVEWSSPKLHMKRELIKLLSWFPMNYHTYIVFLFEVHLWAIR